MGKSGLTLLIFIIAAILVLGGGVLYYANKVSVSGVYPTVFLPSDQTNQNKIFNQFNASNGNGWRSGYDNPGVRGVNLDQYGFLNNLGFPYPSGTAWQTNPQDGLIYARQFIVKNKTFFGIEDQSELGDAVALNTGDPSNMIYQYFQPQSAGYVVSVPIGASPQTANNIEVDFQDKQVLIQGHFYPHIFIPTSEVKNLAALRSALLGKTYHYASRCGESSTSTGPNGRFYPCDPLLLPATVTSSDLPNLSIKETVVLPIGSFDAAKKGVVTAMRLVDFVTGFANSDLLYVDAITGQILQ